MLRFTHCVLLAVSIRLFAEHEALGRSVILTENELPVCNTTLNLINWSQVQIDAQEGSNVTLWATFEINYSVTKNDVYWQRGDDPGTRLCGQLDPPSNSTTYYNASLTVHAAKGKYGLYNLYVCGSMIEGFRLFTSTHCIKENTKFRHINSSVIVPAIDKLNLSIQCNFTGYRIVDVTWLELTLSEQSSKHQNTCTEYIDIEQCIFNCALMILNADPSDSGNYTCQIEPLKESNTTTITIIDLPLIQKVTHALAYKSTENIELKYEIKGRYIVPNVTISDEFNAINSSKYTFNHSYLSHLPGNGISLVVQINPLDPGNYTSQVCIYYDSTVSDYYAEIYNHTPICNTTVITVYKDQSLIIGGGAGLGALFVMTVFGMIIILGIVYRKRTQHRRARAYVPIAQPEARQFYTDVEADGPITGLVSRTTKKVIIVYGDPLRDVEDFCDILDCFSGGCGPRPAFKCDCDIRHKSEVSGTNWNSWTVEKIKKADIVLLVCSEKLCASLSQSTNPPPIETAAGQISASAITNLCSIISSTTGKFIPIFLNQPVNKDIIPASLADRKAYRVNTTKFMEIQCNTTEEENWRYAVGEYLREADAEDFVNLLNCLRGQSS